MNQTVLKSMSVLCLFLLTACGGGHSSSPASPKPAAPTSNTGDEATLDPESAETNSAPAEAPANQKTGTPTLETYSSSIVVELGETGSPVFGEPVSIVFNRYGRVFSRNLYVFKKAYLGPLDDRAWFWWQMGDDVTFSTPWPVISVNLETMKAFGGTEAGEGVFLGSVKYDGVKFRLEPAVEMSFDKDAQKISLMSQPDAAPNQQVDCPQAAKLARVCEIYRGIYETLAAIDFNALGEVGPAVASEVLNTSTVVKLATSFALYRPGVDQIRSKYLVPALKSIRQLKDLRKVDRANHALYLSHAKDAYANLIITAMDTLLKTQKMMPEALAGAGKTGLGVFLAYIGLNGAGDWMIASGQPKWFRELVSPIIREFGVLTLDLILNGSKTPFQQRIDRFIAMEDQIQTALHKLCKSSPTLSEGECMASLTGS